MAIVKERESLLSHTDGSAHAAGHSRGERREIRLSSARYFLVYTASLNSCSALSRSSSSGNSETTGLLGTAAAV
jgi:hypothetical protein